MLGTPVRSCAFTLAASALAGAAGATPVAVYGAWHCGNDFCTSTTVRSLTEFEQKNHCLTDRGDGRPSVNLVVLTVVHALRPVHKASECQTLDGVPRGMTAEVGY